MSPRRRLPLLAAAVTAAALLALAPSAASAAAPLPFGHACDDQDGVRFCPAADLSQRVKSWDGVPLDVDVTLPASGDGPFPTILLLHGLGGNKRNFEGTGGDPAYNNVFFAKRGYAVVTPTARGFGDSCGAIASRSAGCEKGWTHLGDIRYEVRDLQYLVGLLVDEKVTDPKAVGSTGISYGGGFSTMLAFLHDRIRLPNNKFAPWKSPKGTPISLAAAWPRWLWTNGEAIFTRNGRGYWSRNPLGAVTQAWADVIFSTAFGGFTAPDGVDSTADIHVWKKLLDAGSQGAASRKVLDQTYTDHGVAGIAGTPAPLLFQSGWTDALFPVPQGLAGYDSILRKNPKAPVALQVGDLGHGAANKPADNAKFDKQGLAFFNSWLLRKGKKLAPGTVTAFTQTCPKPAPGGGPFTATRFTGLARGKLSFGTRAALRITQAGASQELATKVGATGVNACAPLAPDATSKAVFSATSPGVTLIGLPALTGQVKTSGKNAALAARLWDLDPKANTQQLVTRGVYRLTDNQKGRFRLDLDGNGWKFPKGHKVVVELLGKDFPTYQASPNDFSATFTGVSVSLPVRERTK
jgi:pimeloyl-ACP methyl ester carboxylesterase